MKTPVPMKTLVARQRSPLLRYDRNCLSGLLGWCSHQAPTRGYISRTVLNSGLRLFFSADEARELYAYFCTFPVTLLGFDKDAITNAIADALRLGGQ